MFGSDAEISSNSECPLAYLYSSCEAKQRSATSVTTTSMIVARE